MVEQTALRRAVVRAAHSVEWMDVWSAVMLDTCWAAKWAVCWDDWTAGLSEVPSAERTVDRLVGRTVAKMADWMAAWTAELWATQKAEL